MKNWHAASRPRPREQGLFPCAPSSYKSTPFGAKIPAARKVRVLFSCNSNNLPHISATSRSARNVFVRRPGSARRRLLSFHNWMFQFGLSDYEQGPREMVRTTWKFDCLCKRGTNRASRDHGDAYQILKHPVWGAIVAGQLSTALGREANRDSVCCFSTGVTATCSCIPRCNCLRQCSVDLDHAFVRIVRNFSRPTLPCRCGFFKTSHRLGRRLQKNRRPQAAPWRGRLPRPALPNANRQGRSSNGANLQLERLGLAPGSAKGPAGMSFPQSEAIDGPQRISILRTLRSETAVSCLRCWDLVTCGRQQPPSVRVSAPLKTSLLEQQFCHVLRWGAHCHLAAAASCPIHRRRISGVPPAIVADARQPAKTAVPRNRAANPSSVPALAHRRLLPEQEQWP